MALSNTRILEAMADGRVVIEPFRESFLSTSSYDVCLGEYFYREQKPKLYSRIFNIYDPAHVEKVWGEPWTAQTAYDAFDGSVFENIKPDDKVIVLGPGETILAHTDEFIGGRGDVTTMMKARSSLGRSFITVCKCAGWGDVGYVNRWTMEITNVSEHYYIPLVVGEPIAQIVFFDAVKATGDYSEKGNYQGSTSVEELRANWQPTAMLPRTKRKNL